MDKVLELIVKGSDWESVLKEIVVEEGLDPWNIDLSALSDALVNYLSELSTVNFRIPARFILISAILLRLKSESLVEKEVEEKIPETLDLNDLVTLEMPIKRIPVRNISFEELTLALKKVVKTGQAKEERRIMREQKIKNIQNFLELEVDNYVDRVFEEIQKIRNTTFFRLTKGKENLEASKYFVAMLHLANQQKVSVHQEIVFEDINISLRDLEAIEQMIEGESNSTQESFSDKLEKGFYRTQTDDDTEEKD